MGFRPARSLIQLIEVRDNRYGAEQRQADNRYRLATARLQLLVLTGALPEALGFALPDDTPPP